MKKTFLLLLIAIFFTQYRTYAQSINDPFFEKVPYIGAFGTTDWTKGWTNWNPQYTSYPTPTVTVSGNIDKNTLWSPSSSPVFGKASFTNTNITDPFFEKVNYIGAFGATDWTAGWTNWDPQNTQYPATNVNVSGNITSNTTWGPKASPVSGKASFTNTNLTDPFFDKVNYVGAFGNTDWTLGWTNWNPQLTTYPNVTDTLTGNIASNKTLLSGKTYFLQGFVYVKQGVTITIQAGTVIRGDKTTKGTLIIEKGAKIIAQGTSSNPIVFTSNVAAGSRSYGDWGGLVVCGKAKINVPGDTALIEGGPTSYYGGGANPNDADSSGIIKYVRIEFAGIPLIPDKEINGLTLGGVGNKTLIDYVQVSYSGDDSYEWFGGTVNAKHLIAYRGWDDDFDTDFGFSGKLQFLVGLRDPNMADISGSNFFESDNDGTGSTNTPTTHPIFCNVSSFGPKVTPTTSVHTNYKRALHIRRNSKLSVYNSIFAGWPTGLYIDGTLTQTNANNNDLQIENCIMAGMSSFFSTPAGSTALTDATERSWYMESSRHNDTLANNSELLITDPFNLNSPNFLPSSTNAVYLLNGFVYVKPGVTLTIDPGTIIRGDKTTKGTLIIEKGAKLIAQGTSTNPIVFTSNAPAGNRSYGDWGGVVVCGKAKINVPGDTALVEGGPTAYYGGGANPNDADNSGILKYIRIEFPGIPLLPDKEINGLTLCGVGNLTEIDNVQVSYSGDDSYEWFGGTVNAKHLVALKGWDDDFDTDFGFSGKLQFLVSLRDPSIADISGSNSFESDNDATGSTNTPVTHPIFSNVSSFGPKVVPSTTVNSNFKRAMHIRRNSKLCVYNSIFAGWPTGLYIDGTLTQTSATNNDLQIENCIITGMSTFFSVPAGSTAMTDVTERSWYMTSAKHNDTMANNTDLLISDPFNLTKPNFIPINNKVYQLNGFVYVKPGVTLTIEPGTIIRGDKTSKGTLIIEKGAKIMAEGTSTNPIVFTSNAAAGTRSYGDWGGVVVCGKAKINVPGDTALVEGGPTAYYGGGANPNDADNSGVIKYMRIEFPGIPLIPDKEINGLTLGGVGNQTEIDNVQVSYSGDDSYEWFGGTVNAKHLIALRGWDDDFDTDFGFTGKLQFLVSLRDPGIADISGSNSFESDNDGTGSTNLPQTKPIFSNVSSFGPKVTPSTSVNSNFKRAMHIRRNSALNVYNSVFAGWPTGLYIDGTLTQTNANIDSLKIKHNTMSAMGTFFSVPAGSTVLTEATERSWYMDTLKENDTIADNTNLGISDPFNLTDPDFMPVSNSELLKRSIWYVKPNSISEERIGLKEVVIYPNPFSGSTTIEFQLSNTGNAMVDVFDLNGKIVKEYNFSNISSGNHQISFDGSQLLKGIYFIKISTTDGNKVAKMILE
jgi:hypothetical protein